MHLCLGSHRDRNTVSRLQVRLASYVRTQLRSKVLATCSKEPTEGSVLSSMALAGQLCRRQSEMRPTGPHDSGRFGMVPFLPQRVRHGRRLLCISLA